MPAKGNFTIRYGQRLAVTSAAQQFNGLVKK